MNKQDLLGLSKDLADPIKKKLDKLILRISDFPNIAVAFSGGVDSSLLSVLASIVLGDKMVAYTVFSPLGDDDSERLVQEISKEFGFSLIVLNYNDLNSGELRSNPPDRCYICKQNRFRVISIEAKKRGIDHIFEGSNSDDQKDFRPGRKAAAELGVVSPLAEVGLTKIEIREIAKALGISVWNRPSSPCLATRFPFGTEITEEAIQKIHSAEQFICDLGYQVVRARYFGNMIKIEIPSAEIDGFISKRDLVVEYCKKLGFTFVSLDLEGYRLGSMNEVLPAELIQRY